MTMSLDGVGSDISMSHGSEGVSRPTCLIVEDQALIGLALEAYVEEAGFGACETFPSAAEALQWLATDTPQVAILDYAGRPLHDARSSPARAWCPVPDLLRAPAQCCTT
jgi:DNA-binding NarL/FixJ family response regulator